MQSTPLVLGGPFDIGISLIGYPIDFGTYDVIICWECVRSVQSEVSLPKE